MDFARSSNTLLQVSTESKLKLFPFLRHLNINVGCHYKTAIESREKLMKRFLHEQKVRIFITLPLKYGSHYSINPFPHTTILQQTTLNIFCQK